MDIFFAFSNHDVIAPFCQREMHQASIDVVIKWMGDLGYLVGFNHVKGGGKNMLIFGN